jgi:hypothetical protein
MSAAFLAARGALSSSAVLAHPAAGAEISLVTDASATHGRAWRPLGFFSAQLNKAEANYSAFDRELLAVVAAIRHFCYMLEGRSFVVFTDHKPLVGALHRWSDPISARQQRHLSFVAEFAPSIRHITGASNIVADTLSRPSSECSHPPPFGASGTQRRRHLLRPWRGGSGVDRGKSALRVLGSPRHRRAASFTCTCRPSRPGSGTARLPGLPARQLFFSSSRIGDILARRHHTGRHLLRGLQAPRPRRLSPPHLRCGP